MFFIQITFNVQGDVLTERHIRSDDPADKGEIYFYTIESDKLVLVSTFSCCPLQCKNKIWKSDLLEKVSENAWQE